MKNRMLKKLIGVAKFVVGLGLLLFLCRKFSVSVASFRGCVQHLGYIVAACLIPITIVPLVSVNRWKLYLALTGITERFWPLWKINLVSTFQGLVLPSTQGLDALRMYHISKRHPGQVGSAAGSVLVERMIGMLVWCGIALVGMFFVLPYVTAKWSVVLLVVGFSLAAFAGSFLVVTPRLHALYAGCRPKVRILARLVDFLDAAHGTLVDFPYRRVLWSSIGFIIVYQFCSITCVWLLFNAYGISLPIYMHMAFYPVIAIIAMMPVTIGGFGVREGAFAYFYSLVGVPVETAVCVSILNYVVLCLLPASIGGVLWLWEAFANRMEW